MLYYYRIDVSEGIDVNKTSTPRENIIWHYGYFLDKEFRFQQTVCNGCHNLSMMSINLNDTVILNIHGIKYGCIINGLSKSEIVNLLQNSDLRKKVDYNVVVFLSCIKSW